MNRSRRGPGLRLFITGCPLVRPGPHCALERGPGSPGDPGPEKTYRFLLESRGRRGYWNIALIAPQLVFCTGVLQSSSHRYMPKFQLSIVPGHSFSYVP